MTNTDNIQWKRTAAEGAAIVASILFAFWIDAWWSDRQDRDDERVILTSLLEELQSLSEDLAEGVIYHNAIRSSASRLLAVSVGTDDLSSAEELDALLADLMWYSVPGVLAAPELISLISSGDIALVSSIELRRKISSLSLKIGALRNASQRDLDFFANQFMPFFVANTHLQQIFNADDHAPGFPELVYPEGDEIQLATIASHQELLESREFQNLLSQRVTLLTDISSWIPRFIELDLDETISLLKQELAK